MEPLIKKPRTPKGIDTLNSILSAAAQEFYQKGYYSANIKDIAKAAGIATGTFYIYFDGKYNLYKYLLLHCSHQIRKHLSSSIKGCTSRRDMERTGIKAWLEFVGQNQFMYNIIWESLYVDRNLFMNYYINFGNAYTNGLDEAKRKGEIQDVDSKVLSFMLMGALSFVGYFCDELAQSGLQTDAIVDEYMKVLDRGIFQITDFADAPQSPPAKSQNAIKIEVDMEDEFYKDFFED